MPSPPAIQVCPLPDDALLHRTLRAGAYADCYMVELSGVVLHADYVAAFYASWLFKLERLILKWVVKRPSTDREARLLGQGQLDQFAAWRVEDRQANQLLLCDLSGRTRSWLMVVPIERNQTTHTRLYFGSAVVPRVDPISGKSSMGFGFRALLGLHKLYSRLLLRAACAKLRKP